MSKQRTIYKHLIKMNLIVQEQEQPISLTEWLALKSSDRYRLKKHYLRNNIKLPI